MCLYDTSTFYVRKKINKEIDIVLDTLEIFQNALKYIVVDIMEMYYIQVSYVMYVWKEISNTCSNKYPFLKNFTW